MHRLTFVIVSFLLIVGSGVARVSRDSSPAKSRNVAAVSSPTEVVAMFWQAAVDGDEEKVRRLITRFPTSFYRRCDANGPYIGPGSAEADKVTMPSVDVAEIGRPPIARRQSDGDVSDKFEKQASDSNSEFGLIYPTARMLYASRIPFRTITSHKETVYQDEAIVEVEYALSPSLVMRDVFFLTNAGSWKIFMSSESNSSLITNRNYAKARPPCN